MHKLNNIKVIKKLIIHTKTIRTLYFIVGILILVSCKNDEKDAANNQPVAEIQNSIVEEQLLVGSWKDSSESALDFTLFKDGTARSDNMKTLLYKNWTVKGNQITFTIESIGNGMSFTDEETYTIEKLTKDDLILRKGTYLSEYTKKQT